MGPVPNSADRSEIKVQVLISPIIKSIQEVFLTLWKYLLILGKKKYLWEKASEWDKYLVTYWM